MAIAAQAALTASGNPALLIVAPRRVETVDHAESLCLKHGLTFCKRSDNDWPDTTTDVFIADSFGELGLWYRAAHAALIGGTNDATQGHNPWEAVALDCAVLHGPMTANFATDYAQLQAAHGSRLITDPASLIAAVQDPDLPQTALRARAVREAAAEGLDTITADLMALIRA